MATRTVVIETRKASKREGAAALDEVRYDARAARRWAEKLSWRLKEGRVDDGLAGLRRPGAAAGERATAVRYLSERRGQMGYGEYRSHGLPIGFPQFEAWLFIFSAWIGHDVNQAAWISGGSATMGSG